LDPLRFILSIPEHDVPAVVVELCEGWGGRRVTRPIAVTAWAIGGHVERARQAGCDSVLIKPCLPAELPLRLSDCSTSRKDSPKDKRTDVQGSVTDSTDAEPAVHPRIAKNFGSDAFEITTCGTSNVKSKPVKVGELVFPHPLLVS
jgi:hypothetical protein